MLGHQPGLVRLDRPDAVPDQWQIGQRCHLVHRLLDVVFTESRLARRMGRTHRLGAEGLGHRQQRHFCRVAPAGSAGGLHARAHALEIVRNHRHNGRERIKTSEGSVDITQLLAFSVKNKASDLHLSAGLPPMIRVHGDVRRINVEALDHKSVFAMVYDIMNDSQRKAYEEFLEVDFSFEIDGLARFRVNAFNQQRGAGAVFRTIPSKILTLEQLNAPRIFGDLALKPRGMVLVTGPTGSGKSTTLAAMVNHLNESEYGHVLTIEDPIEFVHESKKCLINQREVGPHTLSFSAALRSALREDPDAILVGEMRDLETIRLAMTAAETGHLVFGTLHTSSAAKTIDRVIDVFPAEEKDMIRAMLSESLQAVISQTLCKTKDGQGRVAAHEIMIGTSAIRNLIREAKVAQMYSTIQTGNNVGMQTLDQNLTDLVRRNVISAAEARAKAKIPENFPG
jgi:twitching motility protein PilT